MQAESSLATEKKRPRPVCSTPLIVGPLRNDFHPSLKRETQSQHDSTEVPVSEQALKSQTDVHIRRAALQALASVVSLTSYSGDARKYHASGTIIYSNYVDGFFRGTVLTSASLIRDKPWANTILTQLKINVGLPKGIVVPGLLDVYDHHYNIALVNFQSDIELRVANFRLLDNSLDIDHDGSFSDICQLFELTANHKAQKILEGDMFVIVGRMDELPFRPLISSSCITFDSFSPCGYDCDELLTVGGLIQKCGIGGPVINLNGEVIGVAYDFPVHTVFLPSNSICRLLSFYRSNGQFRHPWIGMELRNQYVCRSFSGFRIPVEAINGSSRAITVRKVLHNSPAEMAGLCRDDVILKCDKEDIKCLLQFSQIIWDKVGKLMTLTVSRPGETQPLDIILAPRECDPEAFCRWLPRKGLYRIPGFSPTRF